MLYQPNYTTEGAAPPKVQPSPDKVREIVEGFTSHNIGSRDTYGTITGILAYLGDPFACIGIFESIDEMGMSEEGKSAYKECFLDILAILNIEVEWESEYRLKQQEEEGVIYATVEGNYVGLWTKKSSMRIVFSWVERVLNDYIRDIDEPTLAYIQGLGNEMARIIDDEALY